MLSDAAGEDDGVGAVHLGEIGPEVVLHPQAEDLDGEPGPSVLVEPLLLQEITHVVGEETARAS